MTMRFIAFVLACIFCITGCQKEINNVPVTADTLTSVNLPVTTDTTKNSNNNFVTYTIQAGNQYCDGNNYLPYTTAAMHFKVLFDSSAIYTNTDPVNQYDYNKLYGFSDNQREHHAFSARFGWRWCNNQLQLSAYTYNDSVRTIKDIGSVPLNKENDSTIVVNGSEYNFVLNGDTTVMQRTSKTPLAVGYKLLPYFGGDEAAPHVITIHIKELD